MNIFGNNNFNIITESGGNMVDNGSTVSNITSTAVQSTVNGDSFTESLKQQLINTIVMAGADYGANKIGEQYHSNNLNFGVDGTTGTVLNKLTQLGLHAGLGAVMSGMTGNDIEAGAVSGAFSELIAGLLTDNKYNGAENLKEDQRNSIIEISGLVGGLSSIIISSSKGDSLEDIASNAYSGQRIGKNAAKNNATYIKKTNVNGKYDVVYGVDDGDKNIYLVDNKTTKEISVILNISEKTVRNHISNVMQKLDVINRSNAIIELLKLNEISIKKS